MENFVNSKFMQKLQIGGQKFASNPFVSSIQAAMMGMMAPIMVGAVFTIINAVGCNVLGLWDTASSIYAILDKPYTFTMDVISLWVVVLLTYTYARNSKLKNPISTVINSLVVFLVVATAEYVDEAGTSHATMTYLGAQGMFIGFFTSWVTVKVEKWCVEKNIRIPMPDVCPPSLVNSFASMLPLFFAVVICYGLDMIINLVSGGALGLCSGLMAVLAYPLNALISVPGMLILAVIAGFFWFFGIHGTMLLVSVIMVTDDSGLYQEYRNFITVVLL